MSDSDRGRVFRGQRSGHRRGRGAEGLARPPWSPSSLCSLRAIYSWGWSAVGVFEPSVVAGQRWRNHKRCQSREIKGGHLSSRLLGLSGAGLPGHWATGPPGRRATETDLGSVNTCEQTHEQERAAWAHSPPAWKKDDGMNDVSHCYTLQTPTHTYTQRTHTHTRSESAGEHMSDTMHLSAAERERQQRKGWWTHSSATRRRAMDSVFHLSVFLISPTRRWC